MNRKSALVAVLMMAGIVAVAAIPAQNPIPKDYRNWLHVKSQVIHDKSHPLFEPFSGIHHIYVNAKGAAAAKKGGPYPNGTIFVYDLLEAENSGGAFNEGKRKILAVMTKDSKRHAATGGWQFDAFLAGDPSQPIVTDAATQCYACHTSQAKTDYVFAAWRP